MADDPLTPLDVLLTVMRLRWSEDRVDEAVALAKAAAPYVHAKPASSRGAGTLSILGGDTLDDLCAAAFYEGALAKRSDPGRPSLLVECGLEAGGAGSGQAPYSDH